MKKYIFPIVSILCLIVSFFVLRQVNQHHSKIEKIYDQKIKDLDQLKKEYQVKYTNYKHFSDSIKSKYVKTDFDLKNLISINKLLKNQLYSYVHSKEYSDTSKVFVTRDSIKEIAFDLAYSSTKLDSLCLDQINRLESITAMQENQIEYCDSVYNQTQSELKSCIEKNQSDEIEKEKLVKQSKRNRLIAKVEGVAILVSATILTTIILTH
jgi:hypothetical protein